MYDVGCTMYDVATTGTWLRKIRNLSNQQPSMISPTPFAKAPHSPRLRRAIIQIVHRTSYIVHRQTHFLMRLPWVPVSQLAK